jgi:hypothetical protein
MVRDFCDEERDMFVMMLCSARFPTREEQIQKDKEEKEKQRLADELANQIAKEEDEKKKFELEKRYGSIKRGKKPIYWNDPTIGGTGVYKKSKGNIIKIEE